MPKFSVSTCYKHDKYFVKVNINGVDFETECPNLAVSMDLVYKTAKALGIGKKLKK